MFKNKIKLKSTYKSLLIYIFFLANLNFASGYNIDTTRSYDEKKYYEVVFDDFIYAAQDFVYIGKHLIDFSERDLLLTVGMIGTTAFSMTFDNGIKRNFGDMENATATGVFEQVNRFGSSRNASVIAGGVYLSGLIFSDNELRITGRLLYEGLFLTGLLTQTLKMTFGRSRPFLDKGSSQFRFFQSEDKHFSFPSGHTTTAFTVATILSQRIDTWWSYTAFYSLAGMAGLARIYFDRHWASDVVLGAIIGTVGGTLVVNAEKNRNDEKKRSLAHKLVIMPSFNGLSISYVF